jgi:FSR family fosmidomycin resistance protein-like MFS transporter
LTLGFAFGIGAIGGLAFGAAADVWGVPAVLKAICLLPIPAILLAIALPDERKREVTA